MAHESRSNRVNRTKASIGAAFLAIGITGLAFTFAAPATATAESDGDSHDVMHQMMDAMHGAGTSQRMHAVERAEEMMDDCAGMIENMSSHGGMGGGMMGGGMMGA